MISFSAAMSVQVVCWQCGYLGLRVGEAAHPGPVSEEQRQRLQHMAEQMRLRAPEGARPTAIIDEDVTIVDLDTQLDATGSHSFEE
eukprot:7263192-Karenia_brevis.AAC.1